MTSPTSNPVVLAISSGGGHWVQLLRLRPAFANCRVVYATVKEGYRSDLTENDELHLIKDANLSRKSALLASAWSVFQLIRKVRPQVVISTGAAPGYFAIFIAKLMGIRTIWLDSVANAEVLSVSGAKVGRWADLWLTQWPHLAKEGGPQYLGRVF